MTDSEVLIMLKRMIFTLALAVAAQAATAFEAVFGGLNEDGLVELSGKTYPYKPDVMVHYEGRTIAIDTLPAGTPVIFELGNHLGVSSIVYMEVTQASDTLDEMFPPH
jgi:hypothetical protein